MAKTPTTDKVQEMIEQTGVTEAEVDAKIATHKGDVAAHHAKYTNAEAIAAGKTDAGLLNPSGMIIIWHGLITNIPSGWVLCDGGSGTPNLLARFIEGVATAGTNPGATGGAVAKTTAGHKHTMNSHAHSTSRTGFVGGAGGGEYALKTIAAKTSTMGSKTDSIADIRPKYMDLAFLMKT